MWNIITTKIWDTIQLRTDDLVKIKIRERFTI